MEYKRPTKSFFPRLGGKSRLGKKIVQVLPDNYETMKYCEPFVGGGSVFWRMNEPVESVLNDLNKDVFHLWVDMKKFGQKIPLMNFSIYNRKLFYDMLEKTDMPQSPERLYRNLVVSRLSFAGNRYNFVGEKECLKKNGKKTLGKHLKINALNYKNALKNVLILNQDYKQVLNKHDDINTFFYLDPPYEKSASRSSKQWRYVKEDIISPEEILEAVKDLKGKFLISYNYSPHIKELFKDFKIKEVSTKYTVQPKGKSGDVKELLIYNY